MFSAKDTLAKIDPELWLSIENENRRQEDHIELIAVSYTHLDVYKRQAMMMAEKQR